MPLTASPHPIDRTVGYKSTETNATSKWIAVTGVAGVDLIVTVGSAFVEYTSATWDDCLANLATGFPWDKGSITLASASSTLYAATAVRLVELQQAPPQCTSARVLLRYP
jgi:hypothetical protein